MNLYLLSYNNYYNRKLKRGETTNDYIGFAVHPLPFSVNFNPNDGITTSHTFNTEGFSATPDYLIVVNEDGIILSRWFVIDFIRNTKNQYVATLYRDTLADFYDEIMDGTFFIERGNVPANSPFIYNSENMNLNQIKSGETLLKDSSGCAWIVGYMARKNESGIIGMSGEVAPSINPDFRVEELSELPFYTKLDTDLYGYTEDTYINYTYGFIGFLTNNSSEVKTYTYNSKKQLSTKWQQASWSDYFSLKYGTTHYPYDTTVKSVLDGSADSLFNVQIPSLLSLMTKGETESISSYNNRIVQHGNDFYKIKVISEPYDRVIKCNPANSGDNQFPLGYELNTEILRRDNIFLTAEGIVGSPITVGAKGTQYRITLEKTEVEPDKIYHWSLPQSRIHLQDAPYDMFCMPYGIIDVNTVENGTPITVTTDPDLNMTIVNDIIADSVVGNSGNIYDVQLLPYCPLSDEVITGDLVTLSQFPNVNYYSPIIQGEGNTASTVGYIFFMSKSSFDKEINYSIEIKNSKIESQTDMYRLCSPNYNGQFEFNAAMNNGVSYFTAECTYLPFAPYIHVKPDFKNLYGTANFADARGLICGGDFSLPVANSAWNQYKLQNKNFDEIFKRGIQNLNTQFQYQQALDIVNAITGAVGAAASGMGMGLLRGGGIFGPASLITGTATGLASLGAGIADISINKALRAETLSYTQDLQTYNLGNIQAMPDSLTKISAFTINNRIFPTLEYYTCTPQEKEILATKIAWNGMTVSQVGTLRNFISDWEYNYKDEFGNQNKIKSQKFIKGKLIRADNIQEDNHLLQTIAEEINKGVFIQ